MLLFLETIISDNLNTGIVNDKDDCSFLFHHTVQLKIRIWFLQLLIILEYYNKKELCYFVSLHDLYQFSRAGFFGILAWFKSPMIFSNLLKKKKSWLYLGLFTTSAEKYFYLVIGTISTFEYSKIGNLL